VLKVSGVRLHESSSEKNKKKRIQCAGDVQTRGDSKVRRKAGELAGETRGRKSAERQPRESTTTNRADRFWQ